MNEHMGVPQNSTYRQAGSEPIEEGTGEGGGSERGWERGLEGGGLRHREYL